MILGSN